MVLWLTTVSQTLRACSWKLSNAEHWVVHNRLSLARHSRFVEPAFSSMDGVTSRSRAKLHGRSRALIGSISFVDSCGTRV